MVHDRVVHDDTLIQDNADKGDQVPSTRIIENTYNYLRGEFSWTLDLFVVATTTLVVASMDCLLMLKHKIL